MFTYELQPSVAAEYGHVVIAAPYGQRLGPSCTCCFGEIGVSRSAQHHLLATKGTMESELRGCDQGRKETRYGG